MSSLGEQSPGLVAGRRRGAAFRFKLPIHVVDTSVMELRYPQLKIAFDVEDNEVLAEA